MTPSEAGAYIMPFGKHKGCTLDDILEDDPSYINWMIEEDIKFQDPRGTEAWEIFANDSDVLYDLKESL